MNKRLTYIFALLLVMAVGCGKDVTEIVYPEPDYANVELSSSTTVVEREGGAKEIFIATNRESWSVKCSAEWVEFSIEDNSLTMYVDANDTAESRMAIVDVVAGTESDTAVARFKLTQLGDEVVDLSSEATANCYIAPTQSTLKFRADVKGNGKRDGRSRYMATYSAQIEGASYADVVWEAIHSFSATTSGSRLSSFRSSGRW